MNLFDLFSKKKSNDPYWHFDPQSHFRPRLSIGQFFKLEGFDFGWFVLEPLSKFVASKEHELERSKALSYGQKALYFWWYVDAQVRNGGFVQFYYNGYGEYAPTVIKGLRHIGDNAMADLVQKAEDIHHKKKHLFLDGKELFGSDLYKQFSDLSALDQHYYSLNEGTMSKIETYARKHPEEFCVDEEGKTIDVNSSGHYKSYYADGKLKEEFTLHHGSISGDYKTFYEIGNVKEQIAYHNGTPTGEKISYYPTGVKQYEVTKTPSGHLAHTTYFENGNPKKLEHRLAGSDESIGEYKEWHDNGQLAKSGTYIKKNERDGNWLEFYSDGSRKIEAEFRNGQFLVHNCWDENGNQTLKDGTGVYTYEYTISKRSGAVKNVQEYKNYVRHGKQYTYRAGVLSRYQEMENGKEHGVTRSYYQNGKLKEEMVYGDGHRLSQKSFPMIQDPKVETKIICEMQDEWLINRGLTIADTYPQPLNAEALANAFNAPLSLFEGYSQETAINYNYFADIDAAGNVTDINFLVADNLRLREQVEQNIRALKFRPATVSGQPVNSHSIIKHQFNLVDS